MTGYQEQVIAFLKGEMGPDERQAFEESLVRSEELRAELERSRELLDVLQAASEKSLVERCNRMVKAAIERGASDIHIVPERQETLVRVRIDGALQEMERVPKALHQAVIDRWKAMADLNLQERRVPQDGRIPVHHKPTGKDFDLRVSVLPTLYGERVTARILDHSGIRIGLDRLLLPDAAKAVLERLATLPSGLVAAGGQRGSGRTTLIYSLLMHIRDTDEDGRKNLMTVEHPVEYQLAGISQAGVDRGAGMTFAHNLRSVLRSDPDVVFCGETRDEETAELVIETAFLGHLAFTTLSANSALGVIERLRALGADNYLIAQTLAGAVGLRMVRRLDPRGDAAPYEPAPEELANAGLAPADGPFRRGNFRGRVPLFEVLEITDPVRRLIAEGAPIETLQRETFGRTGGSFWDDAREKVKQGLTTVEEVNRVLFDYPSSAGDP